MSYKTLIVKKEGHVATVVLNRPEKLNALRAENGSSSWRTGA